MKFKDHITEDNSKRKSIESEMASIFLKEKIKSIVKKGLLDKLTIFIIIATFIFLLLRVLFLVFTDIASISMIAIIIIPFITKLIINKFKKNKK